MEITNEDLMLLAQIIDKNIKEEFGVKFLSGNLKNTVEIIAEVDKISVVIPAKTYNMKEYFANKVIIPSYNGSYASKLDKEGSSFFVYDKNGKKTFRTKPKNHIGYVDRVINASISEWTSVISSMKGEKIEETRKDIY